MQFAVYRNENSGSNAECPFLVDVQADLLEELATRVVIPLARSAELTGFPTQYLMPVVVFEGHSYALLTPQLGGVARDHLGPRVGSLISQARVISTAIDFLFRGF